MKTEIRQLIRLAYENPELREELLPVIKNASFYGDTLRELGAEVRTDFSRLMGGLSYLLTDRDYRRILSDEERDAVSTILSALRKVNKEAQKVRKLREYQIVLDILDRHYS